MALRGTLGDFGLPDIFQLVGHQQKTGVLLLKDRELEVKIYFVEGNVVKAEQSSRDRADLLGNIMVRAGVITAAQLDAALATQQRTLRRLGDILIEMNACDRATLKEIARLQTTETIYRLFMWRKGTYEFTATSVDYDEQSYDPIRAENILMEGFRMVDEWPAVRKIIPSARCTFTVLKSLPAPTPESGGDEDILAGMAEAMGGGGDDEGVSLSGESGGKKKKIGRAERRVYELVSPNRTVQDIVDVSRMGEFETSKALASLVQMGHLRVVLPKVEEKVDEEPFTLRRLWSGAAPVLTRVALYAIVAAAVGGLVRLASTSGVGVLAIQRDDVVRASSARDKLGEMMLVRITNALETYRLVEGHYPEKLEQLTEPLHLGSQSVEIRLLEQRELSFPYETPYAYRRVTTTPPAGFADGAGPRETYSLALPLR
jgi:hypothetical protein